MSRRKNRRKHYKLNRNPNRCDFHHFLFQRRHWNNGWAKALREHPYCGAYIPQQTLHRAIHSVIHDCPTPDGSICRKVYNELCRQVEAGLIHTDDPPWLKLEWLIEQLEDSCPATTAILSWQKEKITKFYKKNNPSE